MLDRLSENGLEVGFFAAPVHTALRGVERALDRLDRGRGEWSLGVTVARYMSVFDGLRHDPRFQRFVDSRLGSG